MFLDDQQLSVSQALTVSACRLSSNRRDLWFGEDMEGAGKLRSDWNLALLQVWHRLGSSACCFLTELISHTPSASLPACDGCYVVRCSTLSSLPGSLHPADL